MTVRRHLGWLFHAVDFTSMADGVRAGRILKSLVEGAEVEMRYRATTNRARALPPVPCSRVALG